MQTSTLVRAAILTAIIMIIYKRLTAKHIKTFQLRANLLAGLTHTVNSLMPEQKAQTLGGDPVDANKLAIKAAADCEEANCVFMAATKETFEKKSAALKEAQEKMKAEQEGKSNEEAARIGAEANAALKLTVEAIDRESTAKADEIVVVTVSDDKLEALKKLIRPAVSQWQDSALYVETATALDEAKDA